MNKEEIKKFLKQTEEALVDFGGKAAVFARVLEKEATVISKKGVAKIEQIAMESEQNKLYTELGRRAYMLVKKRILKDAELEKISGKIKTVEDKIRSKKMQMSRIDSVKSVDEKDAVPPKPLKTAKKKVNKTAEE